MSEKDEKEPAPQSKPAAAKAKEPEPPATPELGPVIGPDGAAPFESVGSQTGVQPLEPGDIPS